MSVAPQSQEFLRQTAMTRLTQMILIDKTSFQRFQTTLKIAKWRPDITSIMMTRASCRTEAEATTICQPSTNMKNQLRVVCSWKIMGCLVTRKRAQKLPNKYGPKSQLLIHAHKKANKG